MPRPRSSGGGAGGPRTSVETREAASKINFERQLRCMGDTHWARKVLRYLHFNGIKTQQSAEVQFLYRKYGVPRPHADDTSKSSDQTVREWVKEAETTQWRAHMQAKTTLALY